MKTAEAESISFLVYKRIGLKTSSESYLTGYIDKNKEIPVSFDTILTVSELYREYGNTGI